MASSANANSSAISLVIPEWDAGPAGLWEGRSAFNYFSSQDFDAVRDRVNKLFRPHVIRPRGRPGEAGVFELNEAALGPELVLTKLRYNREITIEAPPLDDFFVAVFTLSGACETWQGGTRAHAVPGKLCVLNTTYPIRMDMDGTYSQMAVKVGRALLEQYLAEELGCNLPHGLEFRADALPVAGSVATLARTLAVMWRDLESGASGYRHTRVQESAQQTVASLLLCTFPNNFSGRLQSGRDTAPHFLRQAESFIQRNAARPIRLDDIVRAVAVNERTLQDAFRRYRNTTPMAYLKSVRLRLCRGALLSAAGGRKSITRIALQYGFSHMSRFAAAYKVAYGETPSETLRVAVPAGRNAD